MVSVQAAVAPVAEAHTRTVAARQVHRELVVAAAAAELVEVAVEAEVHQREGRMAVEDRHPPGQERTPMRERDRRCSLVDRRRWGSSHMLEDRR